MSGNEEFGYSEGPKNGMGIIRARTTGNLLSWELPRSSKALETFNEELQRIEFPSVYILIDDARYKCYVGEAKDVYNRLKTHNNSPEEKIEKWNRAVVINDGRPAGQSLFNDTVIRKTLEHYLIKLLKLNGYKVVSQGEAQIHNSSQRVLAERLKKDLNFLLTKKNIINKLIEEKEAELVFSDDLKKLIAKSGRELQKWGSYEAKIDNQRVFIRPGSKKPKGWQITFRDIFKDCLEKCDGVLLVPRDGVLYIPFDVVKTVIKDMEAFKQNTIDIYINFKDDKVTITYKDNTIDVSQYKMM